MKKAKSDIRNKARVLLVAVPDGDKTRHFFTPKKNAPYLTEFAKESIAKLFDVKVEQAEVLSLDMLVKEINRPNSHYKAKFKIIKDLTPPSNQYEEDKSNIMQSKIQDNIKSLLLEGNEVTTARLYKEFKKETNTTLSERSIRRYYQKVRSEMIKSGHRLIKISPGKYRLAQ